MPDLLEACGKINSTNEDPLSYPSQDGLTGYVSRDEKLGGSPAILSDFDDVTLEAQRTMPSVIRGPAFL